MPELRKDPILERWVIIADDRSRRPHEFNLYRERRAPGGFCPFCEGNEQTTPPELYARRPEGSAPNGPGWSLRVVPNKFPALQVEGELDKSGRGVFDRMNGIGAHEVVIETPTHDETLASLEPVKAQAVFEACRSRILDLKRDRRFRYVLVFKNHGAAAGASLEHSHSQLIALPVLPKRVGEEFAGARRYWDFKERCVFCDIVRQELEETTRLIGGNDSFIAFAPFASRFPFETWILPRSHQSSFEDAPREQASALAAIVQETLRRIDRVLDEPSFNFILHTSPIGAESNEHYHWHLEIMPKLLHVAGFEWGSGFYINPTPPEQSAELLREAGA